MWKRNTCISPWLTPYPIYRVPYPTLPCTLPCCNLPSVSCALIYLLFHLLLHFTCRWHRFRTLCNSNKRLGVVLELSADLPSKEAIDRWSGEPVKALVLSTRIFLTNKKGYPVLSRAHQMFVKQFFKVWLSAGRQVDKKAVCHLCSSHVVGMLGC